MPTLVDLSNITTTMFVNGFNEIGGFSPGFFYGSPDIVENGGDLSFLGSWDYELFGTGLSFGSGATPILGTINSLQIARNGQESTPQITISGLGPNGNSTDLALDATSFITDGLGSQEGSYFWDGLLGGSDDWFLIGNSTVTDIVLAGDYPIVYSNTTRVGGDDIFANRTASGDGFIPTYGSARSSHFIGDSHWVFGDLIGGNDTFLGTFFLIYGDAVRIEDGGSLIGGDDIIDRGNGGNSGGFFYGDADYSEGPVVGGDDILIGDATAIGRQTFYGDIDTLFFGTNPSLHGGNDTIDGGGGNDIIYGDARSIATEGNSELIGGDDIINGLNGDDLIYGDFANSDFPGPYITGILGNDILDGGNGNDTIYGDVGSVAGTGGIMTGGHDTIFGQAGNDRLYGNAGNDFIDGGRHNDIIDGGIGRDTIVGGDGNDKAFGSAGNDTLLGNRGNDVLRGNDGADRVSGGNGDDIVFGGAQSDIVNGNNGNDILSGGGGYDTLNGGTGDDILTGGSNADIFVFSGAFGNDRITDYDANNDAEDIDLSGVASIVNFSDLLNNHTSQIGTDVVIDDLLGNTITLENVDIGDLNIADFIF